MTMPSLACVMSHPVTKAVGENAESIQTERLSAILQMVRGLAHESRNALQRAQACLDLLELDLGDDDEQRKLAGRIRLALADLHQNYEDVKEYASPIDLTFSPTDLKRVCQTVFDECTNSLAGVSASLDLASDPHCGKAMVDPTKMKIVLRGLIENSIAASGNGARIEIHCQEAKLADQPAIEMHIRDHGSGFAPSIKDRLFEPFVTTKQHGIGLGLAVCRRIIEAHGGKISAENHPEGGADVKLLLPKSREHPS